jgi:energy-coupling factor transport system ATP-binding protein
MITFENLSFRYSGAKTNSLHDITLAIPRGECILLCGESGCGKTTLLRMINGLIPHFFNGKQAGTACLDGTPISAMPMHELSEKIGTVYQNPRSQFFNIDTHSEIAFGIENMALPRPALRQRVAETVATLQLEPFMGRSIFELSGGEKQKVAFGSIYAMEPDIFLLDEPSANLDTMRTAELQQQIALLKRRGKTIIISEHRLHYLRGLVDTVLFMEAGRIRTPTPATAFFAMTDAARVAKGLRTFDITPLAPAQQSAPHKNARLEVQRLAAGYGKTSVFHDISFTASPGEIIAIVGENGAGKSTLVETLCGLKKAQDGKTLWEGREISDQQRIKQSYIVFQDVDYQLFAESVEQECRYGQSDAPDDIILQTLAELGLDDLASRHPGTLSGGQKQRLAVAVSLIDQKDMLFFDEPTSGLDRSGMLRVTRLLRLLAQQGKTLFVVTHDFELLCSACTRILHLHNKTLANDSPLTKKTFSALLDSLSK